MSYSRFLIIEIGIKSSSAQVLALYEDGLLALWHHTGALLATQRLDGPARVLDVRLGERYVSILTESGFAIYDFPRLAPSAAVVRCAAAEAGRGAEGGGGALTLAAGAIDPFSEKKAIALSSDGSIHYLMVRETGNFDLPMSKSYFISIDNCGSSRYALPSLSLVYARFVFTHLVGAHCNTQIRFL